MSKNYKRRFSYPARNEKTRPTKSCLIIFFVNFPQKKEKEKHKVHYFGACRSVVLLTVFFGKFRLLLSWSFKLVNVGEKQPSAVTMSSQTPFIILSMLLGSQGKDNPFPCSSTIWPLTSFPPTERKVIFSAGPLVKDNQRSTVTLPSRTGCLSSLGKNDGCLHHCINY